MAYGDGRIYWRGKGDEESKDGKYWIAFSVNGKEQRINTKTNSKDKARARLRKELSAARHDPAWVEPRDRKITIGELITDLKQDYQTRHMDRLAADLQTRWDLHLKTTFDCIPTHALTTTMQRDYRAKRTKAGAADATVDRELQFIRKAYRLAAEHEPPKVGKVPRFVIINPDNARKKFYTDEQRDKVFTAAGKESLAARVFVELAYTLGWRRGELLGLRVSGVNIADQTVRIETSKNGEPRESALMPAVAAMLQQLVSGRGPDELVFPFNADEWKYIWNRIRKAAGCTDMIFHDFRRSSARDKRAAGVDSSIVKAMQGWKTDAMLHRYGIVDVADQRAALRAMEERQTRTRDGQISQFPGKKDAN